MIIERDAEFYRDAIKRCEKNIEFVHHGNFCPKEKKDLIDSYKKQIKSYKQKQMSFYQPVNQ